MVNGRNFKLIVSFVSISFELIRGAIHKIESHTSAKELQPHSSNSRPALRSAH